MTGGTGSFSIRDIIEASLPDGFVGQDDAHTRVAFTTSTSWDLAFARRHATTRPIALVEEEEKMEPNEWVLRERWCQRRLHAARDGYARASLEKVEQERETARDAEEWKHSISETKGEQDATTLEALEERVLAAQARRPQLLKAEEHYKEKMATARRQLRFLVEEDKMSDCIRNARKALDDERLEMRNTVPGRWCRTSDGLKITSEKSCEEEQKCGSKCSFNADSQCRVSSLDPGGIPELGLVLQCFLRSLPQPSPGRRRLRTFL